jgi:hypothetical protein
VFFEKRGVTLLTELTEGVSIPFLVSACSSNC